MIVVIVLLLLAIMGTAFVSTTQVDRASAYQNAENAQIDLYLDGVVNMAKAMIVGELFGSGGTAPKRTYRPAGSNYKHYTAHTRSGSGLTFLASRVPEPRTEGITSNTPPPSYGPYDRFHWAHLSAPMHLADDQWEYGRAVLFSPLDTRHFYPYQVSAKAVNWDGIDYPALQMVLKDHRAPMAYPDDYTVIAADADGDGIADAGLWPLDKQSRNGIAYFAAFRIIDNCAAINVNTAWRRDTDTNSRGAAMANPALVPANIGLLELLNSTHAKNEMEGINDFRFGSAILPDATPRDEVGTARNDFRWASRGVAMYYGLGARIGNPAYSTSSTRFRPFGSLDGVSLAYRFCMVNPEVPPSPLEQVFIAASGGWGSGRDSLYRSAYNFNARPELMPKEVGRRRNPDGSYQGDHLDLLNRWRDDYFDYDSGSFNLRPLLVTSNPVSNAIPLIRLDIDGDGTMEEPANPGMLPYVSQGDWNGGVVYRYGDVVRHQDRYYVSRRDGNNGSQPSGGTTSTSDWQFQSWSPQPQKASLTTASFRELWRAYWLVMHTGAEYGSNSTGPDECTVEALRHAPAADPDAPQPPSTTPQASVSGSKAVELRAALAAMNTLGLRDPSDTALSRTIVLYGGTKPKIANPEHQVSVFSNERQPVISEVLVHTKDTEGYLAIELYNPYPDTISMNNWQLAKATWDGDRLVLTRILSLSDLGVSEIGGNQYIVLENHEDRRPPDVQPDGFVVEAQELDGAFDGELILLRPRRADGRLMRASDQDNRFDEGTASSPNLAHLMPIDQIDLSGVKGDSPTIDDKSQPKDDNGKYPQRGVRFRYARDTRTEWRCFYPGEYTTNPGAAKDLPDVLGAWQLDYEIPTRHEGLKAVTEIRMTANPDPREPPIGEYRHGDNGLGQADDATYVKPRTIKLQAPEWTARAQLSTRANEWPFGLFRRAGDVLLVPYISGYVIRDGNDRTVAMNSITMESALVAKKKSVHVGRFLPSHPNLGTVSNWAANIFDYFTIRAPDDDYMPNFAADQYGIYDSAGDIRRFPEPWPVGNTDPKRLNVDEPPAGVEGLININTAPWIVLSQAPLVVETDGSVNRQRTIACAKRIAAVSSLGRRLYVNLISINEILLDHHYGEARPAFEDFEAYYEHLMRLSELLTVRSDSFTVYVVVEGWRDPYTASAKRVLQRRLAFMLDRSSITEHNRIPRIINIPCN